MSLECVDAQDIRLHQERADALRREGQPRGHLVSIVHSQDQRIHGQDELCITARSRCKIPRNRPNLRGHHQVEPFFYRARAADGARSGGRAFRSSSDLAQQQLQHVRGECDSI